MFRSAWSLSKTTSAIHRTDHFHFWFGAYGDKIDGCLMLMEITINGFFLFLRPNVDAV
jgi:hypothetical protein